jgi:actin related protein 2/3 complex subunit 2
MLQLEPGHRIVATVVAERMSAPAEARESVDVRCSDFGALYHVSVLPDERHLLRVSVSVLCFEEVEAVVGRGYFAELYGGMLEATPEPGYSLTLCLNLDQLPQDEARTRARARPQPSPPPIPSPASVHDSPRRRRRASSHAHPPARPPTRPFACFCARSAPSGAGQ